MDGSEGELSSNKEQCVQAISDAPISTLASANFSFQGNTSHFQYTQVHYSDRLRVFSLVNENVKSERSHFTNLAGECTSGYPFPLRLARVEVATSDGTCNKDNASFISMNKFERGNLSFEGFQHEPEGNNTSSSGKVISCDGLSISESSTSESLTDKSTVEHSADQIETVAPKRTFRTENDSKEKVQKTRKSSLNNFPSHVRSLLSTGILDGVFVKYVSWCRENLNAFQFESHAACKTRHPNNHIYFENGKTIYAVVQELKRTPPDMLFDAIQNITGSPINQKNFQAWKESFQVAKSL
ncbi:unnamed protein product [Withania somnifera]